MITVRLMCSIQHALLAKTIASINAIGITLAVAIRRTYAMTISMYFVQDVAIRTLYLDGTFPVKIMGFGQSNCKE